MGPTPITPGPAVHSDGATALHWAAYHRNRRMIRSLVDAKAAVDAQDRNRCAVCARGESAVECAESAARLPCRWTPLHSAASNGETDAIAELLVSGAAGAVRNIVG